MKLIYNSYCIRYFFIGHENLIDKVNNASKSEILALRINLMINSDARH